MQGSHTIIRRRALIILLVWTITAIEVTASGTLARGGPLMVAAAVWLMVFLLAAVLAFTAFGRELRTALPLRALIALHLTRAVAGSVFIMLVMRGALARDFGIPAGVGDIAVALLAIPALWLAGDDHARGWKLLAAWNVLGLADILLVVANALRVGLRDPVGMLPLRTLPLGVVPLVLVPMIIVSHGLLAARLLARREATLRESAVRVERS
jgi:hypothetical protein